MPREILGLRGRSRQTFQRRPSEDKTFAKPHLRYEHRRSRSNRFGPLDCPTTVRYPPSSHCLRRSSCTTISPDNEELLSPEEEDRNRLARG